MIKFKKQIKEMSISAYPYTERSFVVVSNPIDEGHTKQYSSILQSLGGKYNRNLNGENIGIQGNFIGWIFSNKEMNNVLQWMETLS